MSWSVGDAIQRAEALIENSGLPVPTRPQGLGKEYSFPTDPIQIDMQQLGKLRMQLAAYLGYTKLLLGGEDMAYTALKKAYDIRMDLHAQHVIDTSNATRPPGRETAQVIAMARNPEMKEIYQDLIEREAKVKKLQTQADIYQGHLDALSREQSRRESERL